MGLLLGQVPFLVNEGFIVRLDQKLGRLFRRRFREAILSRFGEGILANTKNGLLVVEAGDYSVGRRLLRKGEYDWPQIQWLIKNLKSESSNVVVAGTHIGSLVVPISKHCKKLMAFEADVKNYKLLTLNLALNQSSNVIAHNKAVGEKIGSTTMARNLLNTGNTAIVTTHNELGHEYAEIEMLTLDSVEEFSTIDLIIMDLEGYEPQALSGAVDVLEKTSMLYIEFIPKHLRNFNNAPLDEIAMLFSIFRHAYFYGEKIQYFDFESFSDLLRQRPDFGCDLLFTKEKLEERC
jgi:FkbM family methyltransferase